MSMCFTDQRSARNNIWSDIFVLIALPLLFMLARTQYIIHTTSTPSTDFGSGSMFDKIAPRYDITNRFLALNLDTSWRRVMVHNVLENILSSGDEWDTTGNNNQDANINILDLATGTADVAILLSKEIESKWNDLSNKGNKMTNVNIIGVDPSANMIDIGNKKIKDSPKAAPQSGMNLNLELKIGDVRKLNDFSSSTFQAVTMAFGIRNVPEKEIALCEIHRVMQKEDKKIRGGKLAILEFSEPDENAGVMGYLARFFIRNVVPIMGATLSGAPKEYMHLQNSIKEFPSPAKFVELMEGLECQNKERGNKGGVGTFRVDDLYQLNFGSVQVYLATPYFK